MLMAGGTDVLPNMKQRIFTPQVVVGLRGVARCVASRTILTTACASAPASRWLR